MPRLPKPDGDADKWGGILNEFLRVAHNDDGSLQTNAVKHAGGVTAINGKDPSNGAVSLTPSDIGAPTTLSDLTDVDTNGAADSNVLSYSSSDQKWKVAAAPITQQGADYVIGMSGSNVVAIKVVDGSRPYSGPDAGAALSAAINALGSNGGTIMFLPGTYTWSSVPALPANLNNWLRIYGQMSTINLTTNGSRFLDFRKLANGDTFQYLWVDGFTVDATATQSLGGVQHVVIGTYRPSDGVTTGLNCNFQYLVLRNLNSRNVRTAHSTTAHNLNIFIGIHQDAAGRPPNYGRHILVENCDLQGGNYGVAIYGNKSSGWAGDVSITFDDIVVRHIRHDMLSAPTAFDNTAHVHIGSLGTCENVIVEDVWGSGSRDVGVEVDAAMNGRVQNITIENHFGFALALTNFNTPTEYLAQHVYARNITSYRKAGLAEPSSSSVVGIRTTPGYPNGHFTLENIRHYRSSSAPDLAGSPIAGDLISAKGALESLTINGAHYEAIGARLSGSGSYAAQVVYVDNLTTTRTRINVDNLDVRFRGAKVGGATAGIALAALQLNGDVDVDIHNVRFYVDFPGVDQATAVDLGGGSGGTVRGVVDGVKTFGPNLGGNAKGVYVPSSTNVTIPFAGALRIRNIDGDALPAGADIFVGDSTNKALVDIGAQPLSASAKTVTGDYTILASDGVVFVNSSSTATVSLPSATLSGAGKEFIIKSLGNGATFVNAVGGNIDGVAQVSLLAPTAFVSDGTNWHSVTATSGMAMSKAFRSRTTSYTLTDNDGVVIAANSGITLTLPSGTQSGPGKQFVLKNTSNAGIFVDAAGGNIDGGSFITLGPGVSSAIVSDGTNWQSLLTTGNNALNTTARSVTSNYSIVPTDGSIFVSGTGVTLTLPSASAVGGGKKYMLRNTGASSVDVNAAGGNVDGTGQVALAAGTSTCYTSDGTNWWTTNG